MIPLAQAERRSAYEREMRRIIPSERRPPMSWLGLGGCWFLVDDRVPLYEKLIFMDAVPTLPEWSDWASSSASWRYRPTAEIA